ncbi:MAG TPA: hypothetical protein ENI56_01080 [Candidatus Kaiserbacteria bacterium]|nr:hypothetical protein [Candidatus Kaiserbacteria bacterium]
MENTRTREHKVIEGETGFIIGAKGYLLELEGLPSVHINDVIINQKGKRALVTAINANGVEAILLDGGDTELGDHFTIRTRGIRFFFGEELFGRVISALGEPLDGGGAIPPPNNTLHLESVAPGMSARALMKEQFTTGMIATDILIPLAKGQRQMIIGPLSSGKKIFLESILAHQKKTGVICIYGFVGRPTSYVEEVVARILSESGNKNTIILAAFSDDPAPMIYLIPSVAVELAEFFSQQGYDVLLILDDLGSHAKYLREIALLSGRVPGRESYPGDMFFQQARLLERGGYFNKTVGGGSITILAVLETSIEDISNLVSTNLISATDGHLFFSPLLRSEGYFPAIISDQSVTRVGRQTQSLLATQLSIRVQSLLSEYERQRRYGQFGAQLSKETRDIIAQGKIMYEFLEQEPMVSLSIEVQIVLLSLVFTTFFHEKETVFAKHNRAALVDAIHTNKSIAYLVADAKTGTTPLDKFLKKLESALPYFEFVWQP